jgi:hypothetical protein
MGNPQKFLKRLTKSEPESGLAQGVQASKGSSTLELSWWSSVGKAPAGNSLNEPMGIR